MSINLSTVARNDAGDAIVDLIDASVNPGYIEIRSGTKPSSPQAAATGDLLATLTFSVPAFGDFMNGQSFANAISDETSVPKTGIASWFRIYDGDGTAIMDGDVSETGGNGDITFDTTQFVKGGTVAITSLLAVMPE